MRISIITTNLNGSKYLEETILSVLGQDYPDLEYIIIDGGSTDGSIDIIKKYEKQLTWWISEPDNGLYSAIQKGFDRSTGEIMAWINSDDMYHRNSFYSIAEIFTSFQEVNWLQGVSTFYDEFSRTVLCQQSRPFTKFDLLSYDFRWIQQESVFWRRTLWEKAGSHLDTNFKYAADFELWLRFFQFENLFITNALIGGFRMRRSDQLSLDHMQEYLNETNIIIANLKISKNERRILLNYQKLLRIETFLKWFRFLRTDWIIKRYRLKYFQKPYIISFDRIEQKFKLISA